MSQDTENKKTQGKKTLGQWIVQIIGELFITVGLVLLLFVGWQLWWTNLKANETHNQAVSSLSEEFAAAAEEQRQAAAAPASSPEPTPSEEELAAEKARAAAGADGIAGTDDDVDPGPDGIYGTDDDIIVGAAKAAEAAAQAAAAEAEAAAKAQEEAEAAANSSTATTISYDAANPPDAADVSYGTPFGIIYIPRLGQSYQRPIAEGVGTDVLDTLGLGHYPGTAMVGEVGNFALAGHRQTNGAVLDYVEDIQIGDNIYVQTRDGYYTYKVYETKIVLPSEIGVIAPNGSDPSGEATERLLTLTTCHPRYGDSHRYIVHAKFESWQPLAVPAPAEIADAIEN